MKKTINLIKQALIAAACFVFISCEKDLGSLGLNQVVDSKTQFSVLDTLPIISYTSQFDSIRTDFATRALLGNLDDVDFGNSKARFVTELLPEALRPNFPVTALFDSAEMALPYLGYVGDTMAPITVKIYRLSQRLNTDSAYFSNASVSKGDLLGEVTLRPQPRTRVPRGADNLSSLLIVPLNKALIQDILWDEAKESNPNFQSDNAFRDYFNGIVVEAEGGNSVLYFNPFSAAMSLRLFYRDIDTATATKAFNIQGRLNQSNLFFNLFEHDYSSSSIRLDQQDTVLGMQQTYVMGMGGVYTVIEFPDLGPLLDQGVLIHQMEVELNVKPGVTSKFKPPSRMILFDLNSANRLNSRDFRLGFAQNNGAFSQGEFRNAKYTFNLTLQIMDDIIKSKEKVKLGITPAASRNDFLVPAGDSNADRVILAGNLDAQNPYTVRIFYSKP